MNDAISISGVSKRYGRIAALSGVDLTVPAGTIVGLVGPNGAGKTTLIRILVGALRADQGTVRVLGQDPFTNRRLVRTQIGYMPQAPVLYQDLTIGENITFFARGHLNGGVAAKVAEVVRFVDLEEEIDRQVQSLSGGQAQRTSLAAALVHEPNVLFLDEPTAGVDPELRRTFWLRFRELADSGVTLVVSTHQMDEVVHCDRVAIVRSGLVLADAAPKELFSSGGGTVRIEKETGSEQHHIGSLADDLPRVLYDLGLDRSVKRIDVQGPTMEEVILGLIDPNGGGHAV